MVPLFFREDYVFCNILMTFLLKVWMSSGMTQQCSEGLAKPRRQYIVILSSDPELDILLVLLLAIG